MNGRASGRRPAYGPPLPLIRQPLRGAAIRSLTCAAVALAVACTTAATSVAAGGASAACASVGGSGPARQCTATAAGFTGGQVRIVVDVRDAPNNDPLRWWLRVDGVAACTGQFRPSDPSRTFTCDNAPAGNLTVTAEHPPGSAVTLGIEW